MACGAESSCSAAKRAKVDKEDPLVRRRKELILEVANARVAMNAEGNKAVRKVTKPLLKALRSVCADLEAANHKLLGKLPPELWEKIVDENLHPNDLLALAMTCRFFREKQKDLGWELETNLRANGLFDLRKSERLPSHSFDWYRWVCDTFEILPGFKERWERVKGALYEGDLLEYAAFQGSVEILRWLMEEKGWAWNQKVCYEAAGEGHLDVLKWLWSRNPPESWGEWTCAYAAEEGHLDILKWLRKQDPPCPWDYNTCSKAAREGHLDVLKWARDQDPPCDWDAGACADAAIGGHLDVLEWLRAQHPPCLWSKSWCRENASEYGHQHVVDWIDQQEDESDVEWNLGD